MSLLDNLHWITAYLIVGLIFAEANYRWTKRNRPQDMNPARGYISATTLWGILLPLAIIIVMVMPKKGK